MDKTTYEKALIVFPTPVTVTFKRERRKEGAGGGGLLFNRMQLNGDYKWLSISSWACYSCKGQHYWEGCTELQEGKADCSLSEGMMGDEFALHPDVHNSDSEKQESLLRSQARLTFPLSIWAIVQCILLIGVNRDNIWLICFIFHSEYLATTSQIYQGKRENVWMKNYIFKYSNTVFAECNHDPQKSMIHKWSITRQNHVWCQNKPSYTVAK